MTDATLTPTQAHTELLAGNRRFTDGTMRTSDRDAARRTELANDQRPFALIFGCGDSRVAAEIVFDQGLGKLFVVRTAGHVVDAGVLGSVEYGVDLLSIPLVVVLGHDSCGAVTAAVETMRTGSVPGGYIRDIVEHITPAAMAVQRPGQVDVATVMPEHVRQTCHLLVERSATLAEAVAAGRCAVVGLVYELVEGRVRPVEVIGNIEAAAA